MSIADGGVDLFGVVAAAVVFPTLLAAGGQHLLHAGGFARVLRLHGWPAGLSRPGALLVAVSESGLGLAGVAGAASDGVHRAVALAAATLCSAFAVDAARLLRPGAQATPCGCGAVDHPVNVWVVVRAAAYAGLAVVVALTGPAVGTLAPLGVALAAAAAVAIGLPLWLLPRTLAIPAGFTLRP
jgi:hypothetical protein